jgi:hypothetical protein
LTSMWVEMKCPEHGLERFNIKIVKKYNMQPDTIMPKFRSRPTVGDLRCLLVGRDVSYGEIQGYLNDYFRQKGWMDAILRVRLKV